MGFRDFYRRHPNLAGLLTAGAIGGAVYLTGEALRNYSPLIEILGAPGAAQLSKIAVHMFVRNRALRFIIPPALDGLSIYTFGAETLESLEIPPTLYQIGPFQVNNAEGGGIGMVFVSIIKKTLESMYRKR